MTHCKSANAGIAAGAALLMALSLHVGAQPQTSRSAMKTPHDATVPLRVTGQVTFFYYPDLTEPRLFYGELLGVKPYYEKEWVSLFHTAGGATLGLVRTGSENAGTNKRAAVMLSIVTDDISAWHAKILGNSRFHILKGPYDHPQVPIRAIQMEDPGGYPVEVFQWLKKPE
ncbi:MAG: VOC family protein [Steroidobacteraceae bacterium]